MKLAIAFGFALAVHGAALAQEVTVIEGAAVTVLTVEREDRFTDAFVVTDSGGVMIQAGNNIYDVGSERFVFTRDVPGLNAFTMLDGVLFGASANGLGIDSAGAFRVFTKFVGPRASMASNGRGVLIAFSNDTLSALYYLANDSVPDQLFALSEPVSALAAAPGVALVAFGDALFSYRPGKGGTLLYSTPDDATIESIAYDSLNGTLYFSAANDVFALRNGMADLVVRNGGASLQFHDGTLYIWDRSVRRILQLRQLERVLAAARQP